VSSAEYLFLSSTQPEEEMREKKERKKITRRKMKDQRSKVKGQAKNLDGQPQSATRWKNETGGKREARGETERRGKEAKGKHQTCAGSAKSFLSYLSRIHCSKALLYGQ